MVDHAYVFIVSSLASRLRSLDTLQLFKTKLLLLGKRYNKMLLFSFSELVSIGVSM